jgi:hypothetical protein
MAIALPGFNRPGIGDILGEAMYYFANPGASDGAEGIKVMRTPLESGQAIVPPDLRKFQESLKKRQQQG